MIQTMSNNYHLTATEAKKEYFLTTLQTLLAREEEAGDADNFGSTTLRLVWKRLSKSMENRDCLPVVLDDKRIYSERLRRPELLSNDLRNIKRLP